MTEIAREIAIKGKQAVLIGPRSAGKSTLVQYILSRVPSHFVYDITHEHGRFNRYLPENRRGEEAIAELDGVLSSVVLDNDASRRPGLFVIEEANRVVPNRGAIPDAVGEMIDLGRHYERPGGSGVGVLYVTRRPAQMETDAIELADYLMVLGARGKNDVKRLNRERAGLGDMARDMSGGYDWLLVTPDREVHHMMPVPEGDTTGTL